MSIKNYNKYPVKISTLLPKVLSPLKKQNGSILLEIKLNWQKIVDSKVGSMCFASSIKKINNKNVLVLVSQNQNLLELSYSAPEIKESINSFFKAIIIDDIKFKKSLQC